jgi:phage tail-like protein
VSRGLVPGLATPHPLGPNLPGLYVDDAFATGLTAALDEVLAPILSTLDNLEAYVDPDETPDDFLSWLGQWVGMSVDETWEIGRRRRAVARAARIYHRRGTVRGLQELVEVFSDGTVQVIDNGAVGWTTETGKSLPGKATPNLVVRVTVPDPDAIDAIALDSLIRAAKPAHIPHTTELLRG